MGPTHHLVTNVRFRKTKSTVSVKSVSEHATAPRIKASVNSVYNSSEIDKIRYCQPNRGTGGPTARVTMCPENLHRPGLTTPCGLRRAKVGFLGPSVLSLGP